MLRAAPPIDAPDTPERHAGDMEPHPLSISMAVVDAAVDWMRFEVGHPDAPNWTGCDRALADPAFFAGWRDALRAELSRSHDRVPERVPAGYVLQWYLGVPAYTGAMLFHHSRRVPALQPVRLAFRRDPAYLHAILLRPGPFWCLPGDRDQHHPDARVVDDEGTLAATLRRQVVDHAGRFLRVYSPTVPFGRRTLWGAVTDVLDTGLLLAGRSAGRDEAGVADARLVLAERYEPLRTASTTRTVTDDRGRMHWTRQRSSCCFYYALPGVAQPCATCPRLDDTARARILGEQCP